MATANGKPITNDHPADNVDVDPSNVGRWSVGTCLNPRPGSGDLAGHLLMDLQVMDKRAIAAVEAGKLEVSAGYTPDYEQMGPGRAAQRNILWNHVALVEKGRCGPSCAIRDHAMTSGNSTVSSTFMPIERVPSGAATVTVGTWPPGRYAYEITATGVILRGALLDEFRRTEIAPLSETGKFPNGQIVASWAPGAYAYETNGDGLKVYSVWSNAARDRRPDRIDRYGEHRPFAAPSLADVQKRNDDYWKRRA